MKFGLELIFRLIILVGAATHLVLLSCSLSSYGGLVERSTSRAFVFILFNTIMSSILVKSYRPSAEYYTEFLPCGDFYDQAEEKQSEEMIRDDIESSSASSSDSDDDEEEKEEDDDDDDSDGNDEIGWGNDDEEYDETLESRIEAFIAKVISGWKEELLADKLDCKQVD
ncbi:uncharacterized protein [Coffea arabica]|uniref:Uncharacterized protein n=1 Tax=Coffea arabica TaxID=13443 RepID=A0ABM4VFR5_COFAR